MPERTLSQDENEAAAKNHRYGSAEEKRKANQAARTAVSEEERIRAVGDLASLLGAQEPTDDQLHPHVTTKELRNLPDVAEERCEAVRKEDVKAAAPKSSVKPREAAPDEDVEELEVRSAASAVHASLPSTVADPVASSDDNASAELERGEMDSTISKDQLVLGGSQRDGSTR